MADKSFRSSLFKRIIDLGKVNIADVDDLVRIWRVGSGDEKAISIADFVATVDIDLGSGGSTITELIEALELNKVPYTGATGDVDLGEYGLSAGYFKFDVTPTNTPTDQGTMFWDEDDLTVDIILNGYRMKIGEDVFYPVKNQTGSTITKGTNVRFAGTVGASGRLLIAPFTANGTFGSSRYMGVTAEDIPDGEDGKVLWFGRLRGLNTNAYNEGDILFASTTVAGGFQTTVPLAPNNIIEVAAVVTKSINQGVIFIRPTLGSNINRDEGVKIVGAATGDLLEFQSNGLFENRTKASMGLLTGSLTANYLPKATGATTLANSQIIDNGTNILINKTSDSGQKFQVNGSVFFTNTLTAIEGSDPTFRIKTTNNVANFIFRKDNNEDAVSLKFDDTANEFAITTNTENYPIRIQPHGTGNIKLPNVPTGTGDVLMRDSSNNLVRGATSANPLKWEQTTQKFTTLNNNILAADTGSLTFTPSEMAVGKIYKIEVYHGTADFIYGNSEYVLRLNTTDLSDPDWEFNYPVCYANIFLRFSSGAVTVGVFAQGQSAGFNKMYSSGVKDYAINTTINQDLSIKLIQAYDGEFTFYSRCEILN